ncbi:MAG: CFI-box-CTERM domain-containing protein [Allomuricauda sp.]
MNYEENLRVEIAADIKRIFSNINGINILDGFDEFYARVLPKIDEYISFYPVDFERFEPFYISTIKNSIKPILKRIWETSTSTRHQIEEDFGNKGREIYLQYERAGKTKTKEFLHKMANGFDQVNMQTAQEHSANNKKEGCYIATKVYGSYTHPQVLELREFRDKQLDNYYLGKKFIESYYKYSPSIAEKLDNTLLNQLIRRFLDFLIKIFNRLKLI